MPRERRDEMPYFADDARGGPGSAALSCDAPLEQHAAGIGGAGNGALTN
jgi:hypothetical protein